jgi:hypothetical protein
MMRLSLNKVVVVPFAGALLRECAWITATQQGR